MTPDTPCTCGDVLDEHDGPAGECFVEGCGCIAFDPEGDE